MSRRTSLPGAAELFRSTRDGVDAPAPSAPSAPSAPALAPPASAPAPPAPSAPPKPSAPPATRTPPTLPADAATLLAAVAVPRVSEPVPAAQEVALAVQRPSGRRKVDRDAERRPTGRERHDEKITVYVSAVELMDLERARLTLRGDHGLAVDRGRIVREALAVALADLEAQGDSSTLVRRLHGG